MINNQWLTKNLQATGDHQGTSQAPFDPLAFVGPLQRRGRQLAAVVAVEDGRGRGESPAGPAGYGELGQVNHQ